MAVTDSAGLLVGKRVDEREKCRGRPELMLQQYREGACRDSRSTQV